MDAKVLKLSECGARPCAREMAIPAAARGYNARTGSCSAADLSGGELLFNDDGLKVWPPIAPRHRCTLAASSSMAWPLVP